MQIDQMVIQADNTNHIQNNTNQGNNARKIKPLGPQIMYPITDQIPTSQISELFGNSEKSQNTHDTWSTLSTDDKLAQIMQGITSVQSTVQNFLSNFNVMVNKFSQLEN